MVVHYLGKRVPFGTQKKDVSGSQGQAAGASYSLNTNPALHYDPYISLICASPQHHSMYCMYLIPTHCVMLVRALRYGEPRPSG